MDTLLRYFGPPVTTAGVVLLAGLAVAVGTARRRPGTAPWWVLSAAVTVALLAMTSWPAEYTPHPRSVQWVPLRTVSGQLDNPDRPGGTALLLGAAVSVLAELVQLAIGSRATDVDDVLLNNLGVATGVALALPLAAALADRPAPSPGGGPAARMAGWSSRR